MRVDEQSDAVTDDVGVEAATLIVNGIQVWVCGAETLKQ